MVEKTEEKQIWEKGGPSPNPTGRPKGSLNFATKFKEAIEKLAEVNELSGDELELQIIQMGIKKARDGDYSFYRDTLDRVYGKPQQSIDHTTNGEKMTMSMVAPHDKEAIEQFHKTLIKNRELRALEEAKQLGELEQDEHSRMVDRKPDQE